MRGTGQGGAVFVTATVPHDVGTPLGALFAGVAKAWSDVCADRVIRQVRGDLRMEFVRAAEVTHGVNGWHPHLHVGMVTERPVEREEVITMRRELLRAWCAAVVRQGWREPGERYGLSVIRVSTDGVGEYLSKVDGLAHELTRLDSKKSRKGEAPFAILRRAVGGDTSAELLWRTYERGTKGRKALTYSAGFKEMVGLDVWREMQDEELALSGGVPVELLGELTASESDRLVALPHGFELFAEALGPATPEAWEAALDVLRGSAPWWATEAGWQAEADRLFGYRPDSEAEKLELAYSGIGGGDVGF